MGRSAIAKKKNKVICLKKFVNNLNTKFTKTETSVEDLLHEEWRTHGHVTYDRVVVVVKQSVTAVNPIHNNYRLAEGSGLLDNEF